jgi:predicted Zn-dependent peptidase
MFKGTDRLGTIDYAAEKPLLDSISAQYDQLSQTKDDAGRSRIQLKINELSIEAADFSIPNEFNRLISKYGGSGLNAGTGYDMTYYHNEFLPHFIEQWCWLNSERLMTPVYRGFQGELENVYEERTVRPMVWAMQWRRLWVLCSRLSLMAIPSLVLLRA